MLYDVETIQELYEIVQDNGNERSWQTLLKRSGLEHSQILALDTFCTKSRRAAFKSAY
jgi:hypothetical protein